MQNNELLDFNQEPTRIQRLRSNMFNNFLIIFRSQIIVFGFIWNILRYYGRNPWDAVGYQLIWFLIYTIGILLAYFYQLNNIKIEENLYNPTQTTKANIDKLYE